MSIKSDLSFFDVAQIIVCEEQNGTPPICLRRQIKLIHEDGTATLITAFSVFDAETMPLVIGEAEPVADTPVCEVELVGNPFA